MGIRGQVMVSNILYIHNEKKRRKFGAHFVNDLIIKNLRKEGYSVDSVYPDETIDFFSKSFFGITNILFFYSLIKKKENIRKYDIIQGTTYTPLAFLDCGIPVISHFGSTTYGFLKSTPTLKKLERENRELVTIFHDFKKNGVISSVSPLIKSLKDIMAIELYVAKKSDLVIATSEKVRRELTVNKVPPQNIVVIPNAIEDYWFRSKLGKKTKREAELVYLGRMGDDPFTIKLKGINRLVFVFKRFPLSRKTVIGMCEKVGEYGRVFCQIPNTCLHLSVGKVRIPGILRRHFGDIFVNPSRYEGFCLSLVEAMSQGLVPVTFPTGVSPEIIKNGVNGYLVNGVEEMVERIAFLKSRKAKREKMANNAMRTAKMFRSEAIIRRYVSVYKDLKERRSASAIVKGALPKKKAPRPKR